MTATEARLTSEDRREQILAAASVVFGERGYSGGTTDAIAKQAGISQAYVVRMFGSKENLFRAVGERATGRVTQAFTEALAQLPADASVLDKQHALGAAYTNLIADRGILLALLHLFGLGHDPTWGPLGRECFLEAYRLVRDEAQLSPDDARDFFSRGMLITVLLALRMPQLASDADAAELMACAFGDKAADILELANLQLPIADGVR